MRTPIVSLVVVLALSACGGPKNVLRDPSRLADMATAAAAPMPPPEAMEGVWLDGNGTALAWVKNVDGELHIFVQDKISALEVDPERLIAAADDGAEARKLSVEWPYTAGAKTLDAKAMWNYTIAAKGDSGHWAYGPDCVGGASIGAQWSTVNQSYSKTQGGVGMWTLAIGWQVGDQVPPALASDPSRRLWIFAKTDEPLPARMAAALSDKNNICKGN